MLARTSLCLLFVACSDASESNPTDVDVADTSLPEADVDEVEGDAPHEVVDVVEDVGACAASEPATGCADPSPEPTCELEVGSGRCRLAVEGLGFIALVDGAGLERHVTQGGMSIDGEGWLGSPGGLFWLGTSAAADGTMGTSVGRIGVLAPLPSVTTTRVTLRVNLDPSAPIQTFLSGSADETSSFVTPMRIWDALGVRHDLAVHFSRAAESRWSWNATTTLGELDGSVSLQAIVAYSGTLEFDEAGALVASTPGIDNVRFHEAGPTRITFDFGLGAGGSTSSAGPSSLVSGAQDGAGASLIARVVVDPDGVVTQVGTDDRSRVAGRLALSRFASPCALAPAAPGAEDAWFETFHSGPPELAPPGEGERGALEVCR